MLSGGVFYSVLNLERCKLNLTASGVSWAMVVFTTAAVGRSEIDRMVAHLNWPLFREKGNVILNRERK